MTNELPVIGLAAQTVFAPIEEVVAEIGRGRMVVLVDDEDRENEATWWSLPSSRRRRP